MIRHLKILLSFTFLFSISGCTLTPDSTTSRDLTYGDYYLWLKTLDNDELLQEVVQQNKNKELNSTDANIYMMLLHTLPNSPIHNPYSAKSLLNELQIQYVESRYKPTNLALITLLRDLLNEQLLTIQKQNDITVQYKNNKSMLAALNKKEEEKDKLLIKNQKEIFTLSEKIKLLQEQIFQLQSIEKNINEHGK